MIVLTPAELRMTEWVGRQRHAHAIRCARDPGQGPSAVDPTPANHIRGARCEYAGSLILNLYWRPTIGEISRRDIGGLIDARSTVLPHGRLIIKPGDADVPFILIATALDKNQYDSPGWITAGEAKRRFPLLTQFGDPGHFVDQEVLWPLSELRAWIGRAAA